MKKSIYNRGLKSTIFKPIRCNFSIYRALLPILIGLFGLFCIPTILTSCDDDDDHENEEHSEEDYLRYKAVHNELTYLQSSLVKVDKQGNFIERILGVPLDKNDTTIVTVGVNNLNEAKEIFKNLFDPLTAISEDNTKAIFTNLPGYARMYTDVEGESNELIAYVDFQIPNLRYASRINFIEASKWPLEEGINTYKRGEVYTFYSVIPPKYIQEKGEPEEVKFLCIREWSHGRPGILVSATQKNYVVSFISRPSVFIDFNEHMVNVNTGASVCRMLHENNNWSFYKPKIDKYKINLGGECWSNQWGQGFYYKYGYVIHTDKQNLDPDWKNKDWRDLTWKRWQYPILLVKYVGEAS